VAQPRICREIQAIREVWIFKGKAACGYECLLAGAVATVLGLGLAQPEFCRAIPGVWIE
tara:strand:+ start:477 stop:653 length:177 start_codon:yes stop_codon:yes gene_type:complete